MTDQRFGFAPLPPSFSAGAPPGAAGLLGGDLSAAVANLLGLLQGQTAPFPGPLPGPLPGPFPGAPPAAPLGTVAPDDERRAAEAFLRDVAASTLRKLYQYLESATPRHAEIAPCYPPFQQAIRAYRARDYGQALSGGYQVYRMIAALRSRHPDLPDVADEAPPPSGEADARRS